MRLLAFESADGGCSVALADGGAVTLRSRPASRDSLPWLAQQAQALLAEGRLDWPSLDGLACCVGPGGFTGVRVAVGLVQGLGLATALPVAAVSSLAALAGEALPTDAGTRVWVALDARLGELYAANYRRGDDGRVELIGREQLLEPAALRALIPPDGPLAGPGFAAYPAEFAAFPSAGELILSATAVARVAAALPPEAWQGAATLTPTYLRNQVARTLAERGLRNPTGPA